MHVLYIHQHFATPDHSIGTRSYELARKLVESGHQVTMLCGDTVSASNDANQKIVKENVDGIDVVRIMQPYANSMGFVQRLFSFVRFAFSASLCAYREKPDLIYATSTPLTVGIPAVVSQLRTHAPFAFEVRDLWPTLPVAMGVIKNPAIIWSLRCLEKFIYRRSNAIVTLAPGMEQEIKAVNGSPELVEFIPNGCDTDLFKPDLSPASLQKYAIDPSKFSIVYCGHHGIANGLDSLIEAAAELKNRGINSVQFIMIGKGSEKDRLTKLCTEKGTDDFFNWIDPIPKKELASLLPVMDAGMMPLMNVTAFHNGTSPNKFFDYISAGLPVITNYPGWIANLISDSDCGANVAPDDPVELADAILALSNKSEEVRSQMGVNSRTLAEKNFSRERLGSQFVSFLEKLHAAHGKATKIADNTG